MKNNRPFITDTLVIGFTLFATFFGAGNLVFPPYMGIQSGNAWILAIIGLALTGISLPILSIVGVVKGGGSTEKLMSPISKKFYLAFNILTMYLISTLILVPRTGATTYEVGFLPHFPNLPSIYVQVAFFALTFILCVDKESVVDKIGKYLTPVLLLIVFFIMIFGIFNPLGGLNQPQIEAPFQWSFIQGYQMGDLVTGLLFSGVLMKTISSKGYNKSEGGKMILYASLISFVLLLLIYGSLLRIGATTSTLLSPDMDRTAILTTIVNKILGRTGGIALSASVSLACLTTAVGFTTAISTFTVELFKNKIPYKVVVAAVCIFCTIQGALGVEKIIGLSEPFFAIAYPLGIIFIVKGFFGKYLTSISAWRGAVFLTLAYTLFHAFSIVNLGGDLVLNLIDFIPLGAEGFGWIPISIIGFIVGTIASKVSQKDPGLLKSEHSNIEKF